MKLVFQVVDQDGTPVRHWQRHASTTDELKGRVDDLIGFLQAWGCQVSIEQLRMEADHARQAARAA